METKNNLFKRMLGKTHLVCMANKRGTTLVIVVLALLAVPGVFAAEYLGSAIIEPLADILGPQGWSGLYQSYPQLIEAILFTLFFGGLANKIVGERFGKMTAC